MNILVRPSAWRVSWNQTAEEARYLLEEGLINENILIFLKTNALKS